MHSPWQIEFGRASLILLCGLFIGWLFGYARLGIAIAAGWYIASHLRQIYRLERWLRRRATGPSPPASGVWEEIYLHIFQLKRRQHKRKQRLLRLLDQFHVATVALPDGIVILGARDEILWFNDAASRMLNLCRTDRHSPISNLVRNPGFIAHLRRRVWDEPWSIPAVGNNAQFLEIHIVPYSENLRMLLARDVTQLRQVEQMRSDFVANVSHELRTPLTVLKGYLETLQDAEQLLPPRLTHSIQRMQEQTARMQYLVDGLLYLSRLESGTQKAQLKPVDVPALLKKICEDVKAWSEAGPLVALQIETATQIYGDEQELSSAFSNLIVNAIKFTPNEGHVTVQWLDDDRHARLNVIDNGIGIAQRHIPRLTERFYRVDNDGSRHKAGTGLGLAIVKHVLSRHDAELKITSELGHGSQFSCVFPAKRIVTAANANVTTI